MYFKIKSVNNDVWYYYVTINCRDRMKRLEKVVQEELSDQEIVCAILNRDRDITIEYLYKRYYPLFCAIFNKYYTDCETVLEFINQIYALILMPGKKNGRAPLETFGFRCSFGSWLKLVAINYCKQSFNRRIDEDDNPIDTDRNPSNPISPNLDSLNKSDLEQVLQSMKNYRYREIIRLRYVEEKTNEETATLLGMTMANFYNKHKLAKEQFIQTLKKEGLL